MAKGDTFEVVIAVSAREHIEDVAGDHYVYDLAQGDRFYEALEAAIERLRQFPFSGHPRKEFGEGIRALLVWQQRYLLFYRFDGQRVEVLRFIAAKQDPDTFFV